MLRAVIYARVSTNVQEDNYSFSTQVEACRFYAKQNDMAVVAEFQEVESGGSLERAELQKARNIIRSGAANVLLVYNVDRLSRNLADMLHLREELRTNNAMLHYATRGASNTSAEGGLFDNIEAAFAEYERMRIKSRLWDGRLGKVRGTADKPPQVYGNGNCPYGYIYEGRKKDRRLVVHAGEAIIVQRMFYWSLSGLSVHVIARKLNDEHVPTPAQTGRAAVLKRDKPQWVGAMVWRMLRNEVYAGTMHFNKTHRIGTRDLQFPRDEWIPVPVPAIINKDVFDAVQERLAGARRGSRRNAKYFYLLGRGKLKCQCGYTMTGSANSIDGWRGYRCFHRNNAPIQQCLLGPVKAQTAETLIWDWLYSVLTAEKIQEGIEAHQQATAKEMETLGQRLAGLDKRLKELERQADKMIAAYKADIISMDELSKDKALLDTERKTIEQERTRLDELHQSAVWFDAAALQAEAEELRAYMPHMNDNERAVLLDRVHLTALRTLNDCGEQVLKVECRLGATIIPLKPSSGSSQSGESAPDDPPPIVFPSHSSLRSPGCGWCRWSRSQRSRRRGCSTVGLAGCQPPARPVARAARAAARAGRGRAGPAARSRACRLGSRPPAARFSRPSG